MLPTKSKPDIVIEQHSRKSISVAELYITFETNISKSHDHKTNIYSNLMHDNAGQIYNCKFVVI